MSYYPLPSGDDRPAINANLRQWFATMSGIPIQDLIEPRPTPSEWEELYYGDIGDHRSHELTTLVLAPVLFPARKPIVSSIGSNRVGCADAEAKVFKLESPHGTRQYSTISRDLYIIESTRPQSMHPPLASDDVAFRERALECLSNWRPAHLLYQVPESFQELRLIVGNVPAMSLLDPKEVIQMRDGNWPTTSLSPSMRPQLWEQFLAIGIHIGAFVWTEFFDNGSIARPEPVRTLDDCQPGLSQATQNSIVPPEAASPWKQRILSYHPFATRMHVATACEFRLQVVGYHLVHMLIWLKPSEVTDAARKHREQAISMRNWHSCLYLGPQSDSLGEDPVSAWVRTVVKPGTMLLIPPGTFVIEYSSGAAVTTEGAFLPWACIPRLQELSNPPNLYILKSMMRTALEHETSGQASREQIKALLALVYKQEVEIPKEAKGQRKTIKSFERDVDEICERFL